WAVTELHLLLSDVEVLVRVLRVVFAVCLVIDLSTYVLEAFSPESWIGHFPTLYVIGIIATRIEFMLLAGATLLLTVRLIAVEGNQRFVRSLTRRSGVPLHARI
ncbi:MAG: hypothetical protein V3T31_10170, partial [candidate division Zixibacteria bacterium]